MVTAYQGFCTFRRHNRAVNWLGFASAVGLYVGVYLAVASAVPAGDTVPVAASAVVAAAAAGLWLGWLYGRAVGSPYGNVLLALATPLLVPWMVYAAPFPGLPATGDAWAHPLVVGPAALGGLVSVLWAVDRAYGRMDDPVAWERAVMPYAFRVADGTLTADGSRAGGAPAAEGSRLNPRSEERVDLRLDVRRWLVGLVVVAPVVAVAVYGRTTYGDRAYSGIMLLAMLVLLHVALRPEAEGGSGADLGSRTKLVE